MEAITDTTNVMDEANMADYGSKHAMVYLASPYSDADEGVRIERAQAVERNRTFTKCLLNSKASSAKRQ